MNWQLRPSSRDIVAMAAAAAFGRPLVTNVLRGLLAEAIVAAALGDDWSWCAADFAAWDFERSSDGLALEVRQSASRQSWHKPYDRPSKILFDIRARTGRYGKDARWIAETRRWAAVYVFAHHPALVDADHRDPSQWDFYVVAEDRLPNTSKISLAAVRLLTAACEFEQLKTAVTQVLGSPR